MKIVDLLARRFTDKDLFLLIDTKPFHLFHFVKGLRHVVPIGSGHPVGLAAMPSNVGYLELQAVRWYFTPTVAGIRIHGSEVPEGTRFSIRHGTSIETEYCRMVFWVADHWECEEYRKLCCVCASQIHTYS
jgi:hypothetical protein